MTGPGTSTATTCPYCGVGCGVRAEVAGGRLVAARGDDAHPANRGRLCVKGSSLPDTQHPPDRLLRPRLHGRDVSWETALDRIANEFTRATEAHGPDSVALYLSGQLLTEDYYVANKLMKGFVGSSNVDTNSRLCMASAVAAHKRAFGEDVVPCDYEDLEHCELAVLVGSNTAWAHPIVYQRLAARRATGAVKIVVIDPRRTATCDIADLHLAIRPGSDAALFNGLLAHLAGTGAVDERYLAEHTSGYAAAVAAAREDAAEVQALTGLSTTDLETFYRWFAATQATVTLFSQGVNQASNGTDKANAIINCHLATGRIGRSGCGPFSLTGQPNAMGGREVGGMATQLAAHRDFTPEDLASVARFWQAPRMAERPGLKAVDLFKAVADGRVRALWILGTNPVVSLPDADAVADALRRCPFVVVSDCVTHTDTTACADLLLPAAGWGEKCGTVTNSERCISRQRAFLPPPGEARPDWWAICRVAERLGFGGAFDYAGPHEIFREHATLTGFENDGRRVFDLGALAGIDRAGYDALAPRRWPLDGARPFAGGRFPTADGRARLVPIRHRPPAQQPDHAHPLVLNTGRLRDQWHTMTRTGAAPRLFGHTDAPTVQLSTADAQRFGVSPGDLVELHNARGLVRGIAAVDDTVPAGQPFYPMHWNDRFAHPARTGTLVAPVTDPASGQPESKHATVALRTCRPGTWIRLACTEPLAGAVVGEGVLLRTRLPGDNTGTVWCYELALTDTLDPTTLAAALGRGVRHDNAVTFTDARRGALRLLLERNPDLPVLVAFGAPARAQLPAREHLVKALTEPLPTMRRLAGPAIGSASPIVCTCFRVSEQEIISAVTAGADSAEALGRQLSCGTNCGSCLPELRKLIGANRRAGSWDVPKGAATRQR